MAMNKIIRRGQCQSISGGGFHCFSGRRRAKRKLLTPLKVLYHWYEDDLLSSQNGRNKNLIMQVVNIISVRARNFIALLNVVSLAVADFVIQWALFPVLLAIAVAAGLWSFLHLDLLSFLAENQVSKEQRKLALLFAAVALAVVSLLFVTVYLLHRHRSGVRPSHLALKPLRRRLSFLFALPFIGILFTPRIHSQEPIFAVICIMAAAAATYPTWLEILPFLTRRSVLENEGYGGIAAFFQRKASWLNYLPELLLFLLFAAYGLYFSMISINHLHALKSGTSDMPIYVNIMYHNLHGDFLGSSIVRGGNHASAHFDPILILMTPLFALYQRPEFLLIFQSVWFALGVFPAYLLGLRILGHKWAGLVIALMYALHPSLHCVNLFEFHSLALAVSPVLWAIYFLEAGHFKRFFAILPIILFIREDVSLLMCFVALWVILSKRKHAWVGALTILLCVAYIVVVKKFFMPSSGLIMSGKGTYNYSGYFAYMIPHGGGVGDMIRSIVGNPVYTLKNLVSLDKLTFVFQIMGPMLFLPLLAPSGRVMLLYGVAFLLTATKPQVHNIGFHYQMVAFPILVALVPFGIKRLSELRCFNVGRQTIPALTAVLLVSALLSGISYGALREKANRRVNHSLSLGEMETYREVQTLVSMIEEEASVTVSYNLSPFVATRMRVYTMIHYRPKEPTDYLFLDRKKTTKELLAEFDEQIRSGVYQKIAKYKSIVLYKHDRKKNRSAEQQRPKQKRREVKPKIDNRNSRPTPVSGPSPVPISHPEPPISNSLSR